MSKLLPYNHKMVNVGMKKPDWEHWVRMIGKENITDKQIGDLADYHNMTFKQLKDLISNTREIRVRGEYTK